MASLTKFYKLYQKYSKNTTNNNIKFGLLYIKEAHAPEEDPVDSGNYSVKQHQDMTERLNAFKLTMNEFCNFVEIENKKQKIEMNSTTEIMESFLFLMDNMRNDIFYLFNCWPDRFIILHRNKLVLNTSYLPFFHDADVKKIDSFLSNIITQ
eukprot:16512_1